MKVGILGLGLIGGSLARAYALEGHTVYAQETDEQILSFAILSGAVHAPLDEERIAQCELILLSIYPDGSASWLENHAPQISPSALVLDCCGIKREVCARCFPLAEKYGFTFVGGHPMAGSEEAESHQNHEKTYKNRRFCHLSTSGKIFAEKSKRVYLIAQRVIFH